MTVPHPSHFLMRVTRLGPLVPAKLWLDDAEPGEPSNKLDRGRLSIYPRAEIAGKEVPPEEVSDRLHWHEGHWKWCQPITADEYRYQVSRLTWAARHRPGDPTLAPRKPVDTAQMALPNFAQERETLK